MTTPNDNEDKATIERLKAKLASIKKLAAFVVKADVCGVQPGATMHDANRVTNHIAAMTFLEGELEGVDANGNVI